MTRDIVDPNDPNNPIPAAGSGSLLSMVSWRRPSATVAFILTTQLQFLATLSLVEATVTEDSWLSDFVTGLRSVNNMGGGYMSLEGKGEGARIPFCLRVFSLAVRFSHIA